MCPVASPTGLAWPEMTLVEHTSQRAPVASEMEKGGAIFSEGSSEYVLVIQSQDKSWLDPLFSFHGFDEYSLLIAFAQESFIWYTNYR